MKQPFVIIGLGGIGSRITNDIAGEYSQLPLEIKDQKPTEFLIFDTDINDLNKIDNIAPSNKIQLSKELTVGDYLQFHKAEVKDWFPYELTGLHRLTMINGAKQIRFLTRLLWHALLKESGFKTQVLRIIRNTFNIAKGKAANPKIVFISTIGGGTGSGSILPFMSWLSEELSDKNPIINGILLLPDILTEVINLPRNQVKRVRANGFAVLKELNNAMRKEANLSISKYKFPYKTSFNGLYLIDFENSENQQLSTNESDYQEMIKHIVFNQFFTPVGESRMSTDDNNIAAKIEVELKKKEVVNFASSGVATIEYPYEDILTFLTYNYTIYSINNLWQRIDDEYQIRMAEYNRQKRLDPHVSKPRESKEFIKIFNEQSQPEVIGNYFFKDLFRKVFYDDYEVGKQNKSTSLTFLNNVNELSKIYLEGNNVWQHLQSLRSIHTTEFGDPINNTLLVKNREVHLEKIYNSIRSLPSQVANPIYRKVCTEGEELGENQLKDYHIQFYLLPNGPHPLSSRLFLHELLNILDDQIKILKKGNENLFESIKQYEQKGIGINIEEGRNQMFPEDIADKLIGVSWWEKTFRGKMDQEEFMESYIDYANKQLARLKEYAERSVNLKIYELIKGEVERLLKQFKRFFKSLDDLIEQIQGRMDILRTMHDNLEKTSFKKYVCASASTKDKFWEELSESIDEDNDPEINKSITKLILEVIGRQRELDFKLIEEQEKEVEFKYISKFEEIIIPKHKDKLKNDAQGIDLDIISALEKELKLDNVHSSEINEKFRSRINDLINDIDSRAKSFLLVRNENQVNTMSFWGMNKDVRQKFQRKYNDLGNLLNLKQGEIEVTDNFFSKYIIEKHHVVYAINLNNLTKLTANGHYKSCYDEVNYGVSLACNWDGDEKEPPKDLDLHLDKRWFKPNHLYEISHEEVERNEEERLKAFIYAIIYGLFAVKEYDKEIKVSRLSPLNSMTMPKIHKSNILHIYDLLEVCPGLQMQIFKEKTEKDQQDLQSKDNFDDFRFDEGFRKAKRKIVEGIIVERSSKQNQKILVDSLEILFEEFKDMIGKFYYGNKEERKKTIKNHLRYHLHDKLMKEWEEVDEESFKGFINRTSIKS